VQTGHFQEMPAVGSYVLGAVSAQLGDALGELFPGQRVSDEDYEGKLALFGFAD
jgi:hypothetical protein